MNTILNLTGTKTVLALALGAALTLGLPQFSQAQKPGGQPPQAAPAGKPDHKKPAPQAQSQKDFNKWDKGWQGPADHKRPAVKTSTPGQKRPEARRTKSRNDFKPIAPGIDHSRARNLARSSKMHGYKPLPDKTRKSMSVGRPLPAKVDHRPVPEAMRKRLPAHQGYEWRITGTDLVLVAVGSLVIHEILHNIFD